MADSQATVFGLQSFDLGDACATLGTGSFMLLNTGEYCHASLKGRLERIVVSFIVYSVLVVGRFKDVQNVQNSKYVLKTLVSWRYPPQGRQRLQKGQISIYGIVYNGT